VQDRQDAGDLAEEADALVHQRGQLLAVPRGVGEPPGMLLNMPEQFPSPRRHLGRKEPDAVVEIATLGGVSLPAGKVRRQCNSVLVVLRRS
jgi:hypothetical protein